MLVASPVSSLPVAQSLLEIWTNRYRLDVLPLISECTSKELLTAIEREGRQKTAVKALRRLRGSSEMAALKTNGLFSYIPNIINLEEVQQIADFVGKIYAELIDVYQHQQISPAWWSLIDMLGTSSSVLDIWEQVGAIQLPAIEQLAHRVEPLILALQDKHLACRDRRTIGFMSTQFHFSTQLLLNQLEPIEKVLLTPYLRFVEEQVCIPWQRICNAANRYPVTSPVLQVVKSMLLQSQDIEDATYSQMLSHYPSHRSRRGLLTRPEVAASAVRDVNMFLAYASLCVLEDSLSSIQNELLPLCIMVFPSISVDWALVEVGIDEMIAAIQQQMDNQQLSLVQPYLKGIKALFADARNTPLLAEAIQNAS